MAAAVELVVRSPRHHMRHRKATWRWGPYFGCRASPFVAAEPETPAGRSLRPVGAAGQVDMVLWLSLCQRGFGSGAQCGERGPNRDWLRGRLPIRGALGADPSYWW